MCLTTSGVASSLEVGQGVCVVFRMCDMRAVCSGCERYLLRFIVTCLRMLTIFASVWHDALCESEVHIVANDMDFRFTKRYARQIRVWVTPIFVFF